MNKQPLEFFEVGRKLKCQLPGKEGFMNKKVVSLAHAQQLYELQEQGYIFTDKNAAADATIDNAADIPQSENNSGYWINSPFYIK